MTTGIGMPRICKIHKLKGYSPTKIMIPTGSEPVHSTTAYLLLVNDDLQSFSQREDYLEYIIKIAQGGQGNQAKMEQQVREYLHTVVENVTENHRDDGHDDEGEAKAENNYNFMLVDDVLTSELRMRRNEMDIFDPLEMDEDEESHGNQTKAGLYPRSALENPPTEARNVLLLEDVVTLPPVVCANHYLEFLVKEWPYILHRKNTTHDKMHKKSNILSKLAQVLEVLKPTNPSILEHDFDISCLSFEKYEKHGILDKVMCELMNEMRTVLQGCSSEVRNSGVYVLSSTPYSSILRLMAENLRSGIAPPDRGVMRSSNCCD